MVWGEDSKEADPILFGMLLPLAGLRGTGLFVESLRFGPN